MSALARYFLARGWRVSGSDLSPSSITDELKKEGAAVYIGKHSANNLKNPDLVIYNQAIDLNNPELKEARKLNILCQSYPEAVGSLTKKYKTIAVAGAHGKSTTTAMVSLILIEAGFDPTVIIGTKLKELGGKNFRAGKSLSASSGQDRWLVLEADEWKASFLNYFPAFGIITNIDKEHLDFYKNFTNVKKAFAQFKKQCQKIVRAPKNPALKNEIKKVLKIPGEHNVQNASVAYALGRELKIPRSIILKALSKYQGAWRRMEYRGYLRIMNNELRIKNKKLIIHNSKFIIPVYDDYAHHPTEIKATLAAFKDWPRPSGRGSPSGPRKAAKNALICVFQAHQVERLKLLFNAFKTAFKAADKVILLPTYEVVGREKLATSHLGIATNDLSKKLAKTIGAIYVKNPKKDLKKIIKKTLLAKPYTLNPIIVMMGAGNIFEYTEKLIG